MIPRGHMADTTTLEDRIAAEYGSLSARLRAAADYVVANPLDMATRSLRQIAAASGLAPATFSRLARALGFASYEEMRDLARAAVGRGLPSFSEKAEQLQQAGEDATPFLHRQGAAVLANIETALRQVDPARLEAAVEVLHRARNVVVLGVLGSSGLAEYMGYMAGYFAGNWTIAGRIGASPASALQDLGPEDALLVITKPPFARRAILSAQMAASQGAYTIVLTDSHTCPALKQAQAGFILPSDSPQFFSSYAATVVLIETMIGMLVARSGPKAKARIEDVEARNRALDEYWRV